MAVCASASAAAASAAVGGRLPAGAFRRGVPLHSSRESAGGRFPRPAVRSRRRFPRRAAGGAGPASAGCCRRVFLDSMRRLAVDRERIGILGESCKRIKHLAAITATDLAAGRAQHVGGQFEYGFAVGTLREHAKKLSARKCSTSHPVRLPARYQNHRRTQLLPHRLVV